VAFVGGGADRVFVGFDAAVAALELEESVSVVVVFRVFEGAVGVGDVDEVVEAVVIELVEVVPGVSCGEKIVLVVVVEGESGIGSLNGYDIFVEAVVFKPQSECLVRPHLQPFPESGRSWKAPSRRRRIRRRARRRGAGRAVDFDGRPASVSESEQCSRVCIEEAGETVR